jgi:hypothetical protein
MGKTLFRLILLGLCCGACSADEKAQVTVLSIDTDNIQDRAPLSSMADSAFIVPLETRDSVQIAVAHKIVARNHRYYVANEEVLYSFDADGNYLHTLDKRGDTPGRYTVLTDFDVDTQGNVWLLAARNGAVYQYSPSGEYLKGITLTADATKIRLLDDRHLVVYQSLFDDATERDALKIYDLETKRELASYLPVDARQARYLHVFTKNHFSESYGESHAWNFFRLFNDTIYRMTEQRIAPRYRIEIDGKNVPDELYGHNYGNVIDFLHDIYKEPYAYGTDLFIERSSGYYYHFIYAQHNLLAFIPKSGAVSVVCRGWTDDMAVADFPINFDDEHIQVFIQTGNRLIVPLDAADLYAHTANPLFAGEGRNPILLNVRLRN